MKVLIVALRRLFRRKWKLSGVSFDHGAIIGAIYEAQSLWRSEVIFGVERYHKVIRNGDKARLLQMKNEEIQFFLRFIAEK